MAVDRCRSRESPEVYQALVNDLAFSLVPTLVMAIMLASVGTYAFVQSGDSLEAVLVVVSVLANVAKIVVSARHRAFLAHRETTQSDARRFELGHAVTTLSLAGATGALVSCWFTEPDASLQMVATGLLFGYCAGIVSRVSVRPILSACAAWVASLPVVVTCLYEQQNGRLVVGLIFLVFLVGSMETIGHVYRNARRHIELRLVMANLAHQDPLTKLRNRLGLTNDFREMQRCETRIIAVHTFDLDGFKAVNDQYGHQAGDQLLRQLAERLRELLPIENTIAARVGGDEFVVVQGDVRYPLEPSAMADRIHDILVRAYMLDGVGPQTIGLSIGYVLAPANRTGLDDLLYRADLACYEAKRSGGGIRRARS